MSIYRNPNNEVGYYLPGNTRNAGMENNVLARMDAARADWVALPGAARSARSVEKLYISQLRALRVNGARLLMTVNPRMWLDSDEYTLGGIYEANWNTVNAQGAPDTWKAKNARGQQMSHQVWESTTAPVNPSNAINVCSTDKNSQEQTFAQAWISQFEQSSALDLYDGLSLDSFPTVPNDFRAKNKTNENSWSYKNDGMDYDALQDLGFGDAFRDGMVSIVQAIRRRRPEFLINLDSFPTNWYRQNYTGSWRRPWEAMQYYRLADVPCSINAFGYGAGLGPQAAIKHTYPIQNWFELRYIFQNLRFYQGLTRDREVNTAGEKVCIAHQEMNLSATDVALPIDYAFARACWAMTKLEDGVGYGNVRNASSPFFLDETCIQLGNVVGPTRSMGEHDTGQIPARFEMRAPNLSVGPANFYWQEFDNALVVCRLDTVGLTPGTSKFGDGAAVTYTLPPPGTNQKWQRVDCRKYAHPEFPDLKMRAQDPMVNNGAVATTSALKPLFAEVFLRVAQNPIARNRPPR